MSELAGIETLVLIKRLRRKFRPREDHHVMCPSHRDEPCDCYASGDAQAHELLDELEQRVKKYEP